MVLSESIPVKKEEVRNKLLEFLKTSTYYTPEHVLVHFPYDDMYEERALILERLGRHEQALSIYTTILKDMNKAQEYCIKVYEKNDPSRREVFTILMRMLLNPPTSLMPGVVLTPEEADKEPDLRSAIKLLHDFAPFIEPFRALKCLPDDNEVQEIQNFLKTSVQNHFSERRKLLIQKGLIQSEHLRAATEKISYESDTFTVSDSIVCAVCRKRFSNQSAFARYPDGSIVHFSCQERE
jgi:tetratricopeptide (TPR) repeat protein